MRAGVQEVELVLGDALSGEGLREALEGVDVAYYLIHSMERAPRGTPGFAVRERVGRAQLRRGGGRGEGRRIVYLGGLLPGSQRRSGGVRASASPHLASREQVERMLLVRGPRLARAAGLDRDRRTLALVPAARAAGGAHAGAHAAGLAATTAPSRSTSVT